MISTHVDDSLTVGNGIFRENVEKPIMDRFMYGSHEEPPFRYVGLRISQSKEGLTLDQNHYVRTLNDSGLSTTQMEIKLDEMLHEDDQLKFRSLAAKLVMLSITSRPDLAFEAKIMTTKCGKASKRDMKDAVKRLKKIQMESTKMIYPSMGSMKNWIIVGFADASVHSMPDRVGSVGGQVILMANKETERACVLGWRSRQLHRVVHSSLGAEALSLLELFGDLKYLRQMLQQMYGKRTNEVPVIAVTDAKNLWQAVHTIKPVDDKRLVSTIAELKEAMAVENCADELRHLPGQDMLADGLTKKGGASEELMLVLQTGRFKLRGGWSTIKRSGFTIRSWLDMNKDEHVSIDKE